MSLDPLRDRWNDCLETHPRLASIFKLARCSLLRFNLRSVEYMLAFLAIVTGFWIGWPWHNLYRSPSDSAVYGLLVEYMPSWAWTCAFLLPALPSILLSSKTRLKVQIRLWGMGALLSAWVLASLLFITDKAPYLATAWTPVFAFYQAWALLAAWLRLDNPDLDNQPCCQNPLSSQSSP